MPSDFGQDCQNDDNELINLIDENECRQAEALFSNSSFKNATSSLNNPTGCFINGSSIYWSTNPTGRANNNTRSICKHGK